MLTTNIYLRVPTVLALAVSDNSGNTAQSRSFNVTVGSVNRPPAFQSVSSNVGFSDPGDPVTFTAFVSDRDAGDPVNTLTYTVDFGDDTRIVTGKPDADGRIRVTHTYADNGIYNASFTITDDKSDPVLSDNIPIRVGPSTQLPVSGNSLVFQVEAFTKIGVDGTTVTEWIDGSGAGNSLKASGNPQLIQNATPSGQPAVRLDGAGDYLFRNGDLSGFSSGNEPRTMFFVVDYEDVSNNEYAGLVYGKGAKNQAFGLTLDGNEDDLTIHSWGRGNDKRTDIDGVINPENNRQRGFVSHAVVFDGTTYRHYLNGAEIDSGSKTFNTVLDKLLIGQNLNGGETPMSVAAAFIYNRALSANEFGAVETYIQQNYLTGPSSNNLPVAVNDPARGDSLFTTNENASFITGNVLANDSDVDGDTLRISDVDTTVTQGLVTNNNNNGTFTYNPNGKFDSLNDGESATDSFAYTISDGNGGTATATVTITIDGASEPVNSSPNAVNDSYTTLSGQVLSISSSNGLLNNDIDDGPITITAIDGRALPNSSSFSLSNGSLSVEANGAFSYAPDAGFTGSESFVYTVSDGSQTDTATVNITVSNS